MLLLVTSLFGCNSDSGSSTSQPPMSLPEGVLPDEPEIEAPIPEQPVPEFPDISSTALEMPLGTHKTLVVMGTLSDGEQVDLTRGITWHVYNAVVEIVDNFVKVNIKEQRW
ncbi:hypothetical protein ACOLMZ_003651 [Vibrio parahaemolyticus]|uniref:hypothetical protein n=1 Tax=Vibrio parahaemolyticus TaxID=670 RepID=UPI0004D5482A|nr:hypothetical protein [Vibrio parahaemolyticus]KYY18877.1 hypothetical protein AWJ16_15050 [Vibrio parahaemolyticus]MDS1790637.1 hypothetical protein [Vibrio parahaemolyticus]OQU45531.1 hypothetical protein EM74_022290 [Vibrio parahaemolyticus]